MKLRGRWTLPAGSRVGKSKRGSDQSVRMAEDRKSNPGQVKGTIYAPKKRYARKESNRRGRGAVRRISVGPESGDKLIQRR